MPTAAFPRASPTTATGCAAASSIATARPIGDRRRRDGADARRRTASRSPRAAGTTPSRSPSDDGTLYVGIERVNQIVRFDYRPRRPAGARRADRGAGRCQDACRTTRASNAWRCRRKASPLAGTLIAVSERGLDAAGNHRAFLLERRRQAGARSRVKRSDDFDVSDCAITAAGRSAGAGAALFAGARHRACASAACRSRAIKPGALVDGPELIVADLGYQIDNMEGLAVHRDAQRRDRC